MKKQSNSTHTERLVIRVSKRLKQQINDKAKENEMSVSAYVRMMLKRDDGRDND